MASLLYKALQNTAWRIEGISPTSTDICQNTFRQIDPGKVSREESSALERNFTVTWLGRGEDLYVTDRSGITSKHRAEVMVIYGPWREWWDEQEVVARDQWDIAQALRRDDYYDGISDDASTDDCGFYQRTVEEMTLDTSDDDVWFLRIVIAFMMTEQA